MPILTQETTLKIDRIPTNLRSDKEIAGPVMGAIAGPLIDLVTGVVKEKIKQNVAKYTSSFIVNASGNSFYLDEKNINLPKLTILRKVIKKADGKEAVALTITLVPELSPDKTAFRYVVKPPFIFNYTSAKTKGAYDYIDISLDIVFKALVVKNSNYDLENLRATSVVIPAVVPGSNALSEDISLNTGWIPFPAVPTLAVETDLSSEDAKTVTVTGTKDGKELNDKIKTVTHTLNKNGTDQQRLTNNAGLYEFEITVTESNPYKIKVQNRQQMVETNGDASGTLLKAISGSLLKSNAK